MAEQAEILTLANALDVDSYRAFLGVELKELDDEQLLASLHRRRVQSQAIPSVARAESERWLKEHGHESSGDTGNGSGAAIRRSPWLQVSNCCA